jgi:hypothetical protein
VAAHAVDVVLRGEARRREELEKLGAVRAGRAAELNDRAASKLGALTIAVHPLHVKAEGLPTETEGGDVFGSDVRGVELAPIDEEHHASTVALVARAEGLGERVLASWNRWLFIEELEHASLSIGELRVALEQQAKNAFIFIIRLRSRPLRTECRPRLLGKPSTSSVGAVLARAMTTVQLGSIPA